MNNTQTILLKKDSEMPLAKKILFFLKDVFDQWNKDKAMGMGAAIAYYTIFSIPPLLIIAIAVAGFFFGQDAAEGRIVREIQGLLGQDGALAIQGMLKSAKNTDASMVATIIGIVTLLIGATGVFSQIQVSLNTIWGIEPRPDRSWGQVIRERLGSFTMVFGTGFLLMVSLLIDAILAAFNDYLSHLMTNIISVYFLKITNFGISFFITTLLFAMIYKILPDVRISLKDVALGSVVTSVLFIIGKFGISFYLGKTNVGAVYGTAGTLVIMLVWIFYASLIFLFGAEFTQVYTKNYGKRVRTAHGAIIVDPSKYRQPKKEDVDTSDNKKQKQKDLEKQKDLASVFIEGIKHVHNSEIQDQVESKSKKSPFLTISFVFLRLFLSKYKK